MIVSEKRRELTLSQSIREYYSAAPEMLHFAFIPERSREGDRYYRMLSEYGAGSFRQISFNGLFMIMIADFTPKETFEKITAIHEDYVEISQFETDSSSFKVGGRKLKRVERGICCYINTSKTVYSYCEARKPTRFTKILITRGYFDTFLKERYADSYDSSKHAMDFLKYNPDLPELNYIFRQIRDCQATGVSQHIYLESKVLEVLSLVTHYYEKTQNRKHIPVKVDKGDIRALERTVALLKKDLSAYPSIPELAKVAQMSAARFQMAFRQIYGTTVYEYLKEMRMNQALLLLENSDFSIQVIASMVGYKNAGHFAGIFKKTYGVSPKKYRNLHHIK
jgi:AraC-like DNA-binding protein